MNLHDTAIDIFKRTLAVIEVESLVRNSLQLDRNKLRVHDSEIEIDQFERVIVVAIGKAALPMARAASDSLGSRITSGIIATSAITGNVPENFQILIGGHPIPNQGSIDAAATTLRLLRESNNETSLVIFLISGGGSATFEKPINDSITLNDIQAINRLLVGCGAVINEMNIVRRFFSAVKGGRLAEAACKARQISFYISDVNDDDLATVSSGPTLQSSATRADFDRIVAKYDLLDRFPSHISELISSGALPDLPQSWASNSRTHHLLLDNRVALGIARKLAEESHDCIVEIADDLIEGDVEEMARLHLARLDSLHATNPGKTVCLLSGGEVICPVRGNGEGGRNQEFVLRAALQLGERADQNQQETIAILSAGTDGIDGHSPAAGAVADELTVRRARSLGLDPIAYLERSDSYNFFTHLGDAIMTGPTGNNVRDLRILLAR